MFNPEEISKDLVLKVLFHTQWKMLNNLFFAPPPLLGPLSSQPHPAVQSPIRDGIEQLCKAANGELQHDADGYLAMEIMQITQDIAEMLYVSPMGDYQIPDAFWKTTLGQLIIHAQLWAQGDKLITMSEAAHILRGVADVTTLNYIASLVKTGKLTRYADPCEANPQRASRVSLRAVERLRDAQGS
ncbi:MAG: hypothetical protein OHK0046_47890 [Anaerolineae bacterium]